jgi:predicted TIM-barrel fold metal-dependent hydrolase
MKEVDMKNGFKAMDSDMHVLEPADLWQRYIDPAFADRAPVGLTRHKRDLGIQVDGKVVPKSPAQPNPMFAKMRERIINERYANELARGFDNVAQLGAMDKEGLDVAVLFPSRGLFVLAVDGMDPELAAAIARAYNDWMTDFCAIAPRRMYGAAMVAPHNVASAIDETRRAAKKLGFKSIFIRPNHVNGRRWSDPYYDPLWEECQSLNLPVGFHEAGRVYLPQPAISDLIPTFSMFNTLSFPMANMFACADMIYGGVMERFPRLKVAFLEGNCSWIPWLLWRMGEYMELTCGVDHPQLTLEPLEYFQRQCFGAVECDEITAKNIPDFGLEDNIVFSTDYPHLDVKYPHAVESFLKLPFSDQTKRKYLWDNCARLYGL